VHARKEREARGYRWETAAPGNYLNVKSGVGSERIVSGLAGELAAWITSEFPDLAEPRYRFSVGSWARAESIVGLLTRRLDDLDVVDAGGEVRESILTSLRQAERRASEERAALGLTCGAREGRACTDRGDGGGVRSRRAATAWRRGAAVPSGWRASFRRRR
jgi:hypothetical protein